MYINMCTFNFLFYLYIHIYLKNQAGFFTPSILTLTMNFMQHVLYVFFGVIFNEYKCGLEYLVFHADHAPSSHSSFLSRVHFFFQRERNYKIYYIHIYMHIQLENYTGGIIGFDKPKPIYAYTCLTFFCD
jgi:hypothetical protein